MPYAKGHSMLKGWSLIFYGTTLPIDKHDPISVRLEPNSSLNQNKYPVIVLSKQGTGSNSKSNRKQQTMPPYVIVPPTQTTLLPPTQTSRKNGKNKKNQRTTTSIPSVSTLYRVGYVNISPPDQSKKMSLNSYLASLKATTAKALLNNVDTTGDKYAYDKLPIKQPKQVKDYGTPSSSSSSTQTATTTKSTTTSAAASASNTAWLNIDYWTMATSNPNIPELFQRYEKIQEVYPEFHPYIGGKNAPTRSPPFSSSFFSGGGAGGGLIVGGGGSSNGKPSRENAKSQFFADHQQYVPSSASIAATSKKSAAASLSQHNPNSRILTAQSNGKG